MVTHEKKNQIKPIALVILDGFGFNKNIRYNAVAQAYKPHFAAWLQRYPHVLLTASGTSVGLLPCQMGNSEVGHLTIGAGRVIEQDITRILSAIDNGSFFSNKTIIDLFEKISKKNSRLHIMGLLSDGGVHSHEKIAFALLKMAKKQNITDVYVHAFLDGRDVPPQSAAHYLQKLDKNFAQLNLGKLGSITGRFYAMDRDKNWERTQQVYEMLTTKKAIPFASWHAALDHYYHQKTTDEFVPPTQLDASSNINKGDGVICFNFRADRAWQLTAAFVDPTFNYFPTQKIDLNFFATMTDYNHQNNIATEVIYKPINITNTLKEILEKNGKSIFSIAETEKYAHVTYFFNGGKEQKLPNEKRVLIPSIPAKNYVNHPSMSAPEITKAIIDSLQTDPRDFYLINYANADMVGHSGNLQATIKAIECLDEQLSVLYKEFVEKRNGTLYITADHGNAEDMFDEKTGQPKTAHTTNPVYFLMLKKDVQPAILKNLHGLSDIAPFIVEHMGLPLPKEMKKKS